MHVLFKIILYYFRLLQTFYNTNTSLHDSQNLCKSALLKTVLSLHLTFLIAMHAEKGNSHKPSYLRTILPKILDLQLQLVGHKLAFEFSSFTIALRVYECALNRNVYQLGMHTLLKMASFIKAVGVYH